MTLGDVSVRGNVRRECLIGDVSVGEMSFGELSGTNVEVYN